MKRIATFRSEFIYLEGQRDFTGEIKIDVAYDCDCADASPPSDSQVEKAIKRRWKDRGYSRGKLALITSTECEYDSQA